MAEIKSQKHSELFSLFNHKVMGSTDPEVKFGKPSPDIFLVAAQRFSDKPNPEKVNVALFFFFCSAGIYIYNLKKYF